jgi:hypothetical protein
MYRALVWSLVVLVPLPAAWADEKKDKDEGINIKGKLDPDDPRDKVMAKSPHKVHDMKMTAGKTYQIDLVSKAFDSFLRLEDAAGKQLAFDDDGGGFPNARLIFKAPRDGDYRIIVTSFDGKAGDYVLTAAPASKQAIARAALQEELLKTVQAVQRDLFVAQQAVQKELKLAKNEEEKEKILTGFLDKGTKLADRLTKIATDHPREQAGMQARFQAMQISDQCLRTLAGSPKVLAIVIEKTSNMVMRRQAADILGQTLRDKYEKAYQAKDKNAGTLHQEAETTLTEMSKRFADKAELMRVFDDALFKLKTLSLGKTAPEIEGEDLDGKKFKLSDYRGKVVVLDFWGNW